MPIEGFFSSCRDEKDVSAVPLPCYGTHGAVIVLLRLAEGMERLRTYLAKLVVVFQRSDCECC